MFKKRTVPLLVRGAIVALLAIIAVGLLSGPARFRPDPQSAEAALLSEVKKLLASDGEAGDVFGWSVAVSGDTAIVGAPYQNKGGNDAGAAYVFGRDEGGADNWGEAKKLTASDAQADDAFGASVAVSGDTAVVGAYGEDAGGSAAGAAYVFEDPPPTATPTPKDPNGDTDGDTLPNGSDPDDDDDGCTDQKETGPDLLLGGRRNPHHFWDFYDTPNGSNVRDQAIDIGDLFRVVDRFGTSGDENIDPLSAPPASGYHTAFDRSPAGPGGDPWDLGPADGTIDIGDIMGAVNQFGHSCA